MATREMRLTKQRLESPQQTQTTSSMIASEFIGTYILVATVGCNIMGGSGTWASLSNASSLMVMVYSLGFFGAHFNPAVTFALWLGNECTGMKALKFIAVQLLAGALAGFSYMSVFGGSLNLMPAPGYGWAGAMTIEVLYTFMLCFVVLQASVSKSNPRNNEYFGLAIGFVIVAGGYAGGRISCGCFNPAVAMGVDMASAHNHGMYWSFWYLIYELIGAGLAALAYRMFESDSVDPSVKKFCSEFLGTFFLVFTVGLNVLGMSPASALSIGSSLMCMIYALSKWGAHFNPAVTTALTLCGKAHPGDLVLYISAQLLGGLVAGLAYMTLEDNAFTLRPQNAKYGWGSVGFMEIIYTFVLCFTVLNVPGREEGRQIYGLAIGFCIIVGGFACGSISGGSLNPAVSLGVDSSASFYGANKYPLTEFLAYSVFELTGAVLAAVLTNIVRPSTGLGFTKELE